MELKKAARSFVGITSFNLLGLCFVLVLQVSIASRFGAGFEYDAYLAAVAIPMALSLTIPSSLSVIFIPIFHEYRAGNKEEEAWKLANSIMNGLFLFFVPAIVTAIILAAPIIDLTAPGFAGDKRRLAIQLFRFIVPMSLFLGLTGFLKGVHQALFRFTLPAALPSVQNGIVILFIFFLGRRWGIRSLAFGVLAGSIMQFLLIFRSMLAMGKYRLHLSIRHPAFKTVLKSLLPLLAATALFQLMTIIQNAFASGLSEGAISYLGYANRLLNIMVLLTSAGVATIFFPLSAQLSAEGNMERLGALFSRSLVFILFLALPAMVLILLNGEWIVGLLLQRGAFSVEDTRNTAFALFFLLGLYLNLCLSGLVVNVCYSCKDFATPLKINAVSLPIYILLAWIPGKDYGFLGLAGALSLTSLFQLGLFYRAVYFKVPAIPWEDLRDSINKILACSLFLALADMLVNRFLLEPSLHSISFKLVISLASSLSFYLLLICSSSIKEKNFLLERLKTKNLMFVLETIRKILATVTRRLPRFRGLGRGWRMINRLFLNIGADPLVKAKMHNGTTMLVDLRSNTEAIAYYRGEYDAFLVKIVLSLFDFNSIFLDIGANIGFYTLAVAKEMRERCGSGHVLCFEPFQENYRRIAENLEINRLTSSCRLFNVGLSNKDREGILTLREDFERGAMTGNAAVFTDGEIDQGFKKAPIQLKRLDSIWDGMKRPGNIDFVKMDVEGHEDYCLEGAFYTFAENRPTILMEVNKPYYESREINMDERMIPLIPKNYILFKQAKSGWERTNSFDACSPIDNIFLVPQEKMEVERYSVFQ